MHLLASTAATVKFHEFPSGSVVHDYQPNSSTTKTTVSATDADRLQTTQIRSISWCKDGSWLALVPHRGPAEIISVRAEQVKLLQTVHNLGSSDGDEQPTCVSFQKNTRKNIAFGTASGSVLVYDIKSRSVKKRFPPIDSATTTRNNITYVEFTARDAHIVAATDHGDVLVYNCTSNNSSNNLSAAATLKLDNSGNVSALRCNLLQNKLIAGGSTGGTVLVWDLNTGKQTFSMNCHREPVSSVSFSPINSNLLVSSGLDRQFCFYDVIGGNKCIATIAIDDDGLTGVDFASAGTFFAVGSQSGHVHVYDSRRIQHPVHSYRSHLTAVRHLAFQMDRDTVIADSSVCSSSSVSRCTSTTTKDTISPIAVAAVTDAATVNNISTDEVLNLTNTNNNSNKSFDCLPNTTSTKKIGGSSLTKNDDDSFIAALGLDQNNSSVAWTNKTTVCSSMAVLAMQRTPIIGSTLGAKLFDNKSRSPASSGGGKGFMITPPQQSSTPNPPIITTKCSVAQEEQQPSVTAITSTSNTINNKNDVVITKDSQSVLLNRMLHDFFETDIKNDLLDAARNTRLPFMEMQMSMVKQFIKMDDFMNAIRNRVLFDEDRVELRRVMEEEVGQLRERLALIEQDLAMFKKGTI